jgi:hypothetical protein
MSYLAASSRVVRQGRHDWESLHSSVRLDRLIVAMNGTSMRLLVATCLFLHHATAFYIDGVAPQSFHRGDVYVNLAEMCF